MGNPKAALELIIKKLQDVDKVLYGIIVDCAQGITVIEKYLHVS